jgi:hypothetical protein
MEEHMRKSTITVAFAIGAAMTLPAHAGKYGCTFFNDLSVLKQCEIDSGAAGNGWYCDQSYGGSMMSVCYAQKSGGSDSLKCEYYSNIANVAELAKRVEIGDAKIASEQPDFRAGGITVGPPANLALTVAYRENTSAPVFQAACAPKLPGASGR